MQRSPAVTVFPDETSCSYFSVRDAWILQRWLDSALVRKTSVQQGKSTCHLLGMDGYRGICELIRHISGIAQDQEVEILIFLIPTALNNHILGDFWGWN